MKSDCIRLRLFKIAARIEVSVRRMLFECRCGYTSKDLFGEVQRRIVMLARRVSAGDYLNGKRVGPPRR